MNNPIVDAIAARLPVHDRPVGITSISARAVRVPLARPVGAGGTLLASRDYLCLELGFSDGSRGIGFSYIGTTGARTALTAFEEMILPQLAALDATKPFELQAALVAATRIQGRSGILMNVISAVDIAVWDACARRAGLSLACFLGATTLSVDAYGSGGYYTSDEGLVELERELAGWQALGFERIKLKVRGDQRSCEFARLDMARAAVGHDGLVMLDFYHAYTQREEAWHFVAKTAAIDPYWIEDPFAADDLASFAWLARRSGMRLATGEFQSNALPFEHAGLIGAASVVQAEAPRCGGISGWLKLADVADRHGMTMHPCWFHHLHAHLVPCVPNGGFVEYFNGTDVLNFDLLIDQAFVPQAGKVLIPDRPGVGFDFDPRALARYTVRSLDERLTAAR
jgi:L-alanine-DL-glutamate epimerase-like enolase superfamily enzyme